MKRLLLILSLGSIVLAPVDSLDRQVQRAVQSARRPALERPVRLVNGLGDRVVVVSALLGIAVLDPVAGPATVRTILIAMIPTNAIVEGGKFAFNRTRPDGDRKRANSSFPSSHAANAFAIAWVLARRWRRGLPWFLILATGVALARMYLNRHYMSDVVVGSAIGWICADRVLAWRAARAARARPGDPGAGR
jgi:membrane-associated phospholipid phosphatase